MDTSVKNIKVNSSSLVSLKAELLRKEQEYYAERQSSNRSNIPKVVKIKEKPGSFLSQNAGVAQRAAKDLEEELEAANAAKNSREILEKKAKIYDAMAKGIIQDDEDNEDCLVNFHQKEFRWSRDEDKQQPDVSTFGTRSEVEQEESATTGPIHYANVQHNEIRTHGVGYFQFSEDNEKRQEQIDLLNHLRSQTEDQKAKKDRLKEKRQNLMAQRLAKMRQRRGLPDPPPEQDEAKEKTEIPEIIPLKRDDTWRQTAAITREWDKGKKKDYNKSYLEIRRDERLSVFAPTTDLQLGSVREPTLLTSPNCMPAVTFQKPVPTNNKPASTIPRIPKPKMNIEDIAKALKSIRSETEKLGPMTSETNSSVVKSGSSFPTTSKVLDNSPPAPPHGGDNPPPVPPHAGDSHVTNLGEIPLPPSKPLAPPQPKGPAFSSLDCSSTANPTLTAVPGSDSGEWTSHVSGGHVANCASHLIQSGVPAGEVNASVTPGIYPGVPHWQDVDTNYPPPSLPLLHPPNLVIHPPHPTGEPAGLNKMSCTEQSEPASAVSDPAMTTLFGGPAESAAGTENVLKRHMAPQPAHYSSAPSKVKCVRTVYERINLHELPLTLPAPPTESNVPQYRAQDSANIPRVWKDGNKQAQNKDIMHMWKSQFDYKEPK